MPQACDDTSRRRGLVLAAPRAVRTPTLFAIAITCACSSSKNATTPDARATDAAPTADAAQAIDAGSGPSCAGLAYCEDFDELPDGALANATTLGPWAVAVSGVTAEIDATNPYHSAKSLHIIIPSGVNTGSGGTPSHATLTQKAGAGSGLVAGDNLFGRAMIYYSDTGSNGLPIGVHSWFFIASGTSSQLGSAASLNLGGGGAKLQLNYSPGDKSVQGGTMTAGAWHCVQWEYDGAIDSAGSGSGSGSDGSGATPANVAKVWIDGSDALDIPATQGWDFATPWNAFSFGYTHYQTLTNPVEVFLDDFALDHAMIDCPQ